MPLMHTPSPPPSPPQIGQRICLPVHSSTTPDRTARLLVRDRRRRYLALHPEYFSSPALEVAEPLLYDVTVRRFMSAAERREAKPDTGIAAGMAAALVGAEARVAMLSRASARAGTSGEAVVDYGEVSTKEEGLRVWRERVERRFLEGEDGDFDYAVVDEDPAFDDVEEDTRRRQDEYFDGQEEEFVGDGKEEGQTGVQDF
ncbi:hypothetical protein K461DRAFT_310355 [Myriangium duriaei CBS 260.36]|uniref:CCD97-like C-terminal domain-containing protein n=1 Tax=Myriangium duriaei CBS 260.36 TaxID=1168546 RepID=A0A9P4J7V9_9PEZI|nr:hypothetical protein K461DRAFT_310355 [Myriangium duriaei CBS 260.36]